MTYSNGDRRIGYFDQTWEGKATFEEKGKRKPWFESWIDGYYPPEVHIYKSAIDQYQDVKVEIICKVHARNTELKLLKGGINLQNIQLEPFKMPDQEVSTLKFTLDYSDDPFQTYTCGASKGGIELASESLHVRNPFFLFSYGDCGAQLNENHVKRFRSRRSGHGG